MCLNKVNENCNCVCGVRVYYFEDTDFCLKKMYSVIGNVGDCPDKKVKLIIHLPI